MHKQILRLAAGLIACAAPAWAAATELPAYETYSAAADVGTNIFSYDPVYVPLLDVTTTAGAIVQIAGAGHSSSASTTLGSNHAYASASTLPSTVIGAGSFSGWYDQVTINGDVGTGTIQFTVQLSGTVNVGQYAGSVAYGLYASSLHPTQLLDTLNIVDTAPLPTQPWALDAPLGFNDTPELTTVSAYLLGASPYNDTSILFPSAVYPTDPGISGIPAITDPSLTLGDAGLGFPEYVPDLILTPGANQAVNVTLTGTLTFTYGEAFYLIGALGTAVVGDGLGAFCTFDIGTECTPTPKDGTGVTTLDFSNSAHLTSIALPQGASFASASGAAYNITAVPEPGEWLMLLAGLGLVGWRVRRRT